MRRSGITILCLLALLPGQMASAEPEEQPTIIETPAVYTPVPVPVTQPFVHGDKTYSQLPQAPDMPYVPAYTGAGKLFYRARKMVDNKTGVTGLEATWNVKEPPSTVLDWYKTALRQMQWNLDNVEVAENGVAAKRLKDGYRCIVMANESTEPGYKTKLTVTMTIFKPVEDEQPRNSNNRSNGPITNSKPTGTPAAKPGFQLFPH